MRTTKNIFKLALVGAVLLGFCSQSMAAIKPELKQYYDRFELVKNSKGEDVFKDKRITENIGFGRFGDFIHDFINEKDSSRYFDYSCSARQYDAYEESDLSRIEKHSLKAVAAVQELVSGPARAALDKLSNILSKKGTQYVTSKDYSTVINLDDHDYFFEQSIGHKFIDKGFKLILSELDLSGSVKLLTFLAYQYQSAIDAKKNYSQSILFYYLTTFNASELGLTELQHKRALSGYFSSRIISGNFFALRGFYDNYKKRKKLKKIEPKWNTWGAEAWEILRARAIERSKHEDVSAMFLEGFSWQGDLFAIGLPRVGDSDLVVNLVQRRKRGDHLPAVVLDTSCSDYEYLKRRHQFLTKLSVSLLPGVARWPIQNLPPSRNWYKNLKYSGQVSYEAMVYAYFVSSGQLDKAEMIKYQSMNPLLTDDY